MKIFPVGFKQEIVRMISAKKKKRRTRMDDQLASRIFSNLAKKWKNQIGNIKYRKPDFQTIKYYAARK